MFQIMKKLILIAAIAAFSALGAMAQQPGSGEQAAQQQDLSNRILRLQFFRDKLNDNPLNITVMAGAYILVQDICNTPSMPEIRQAQDIVSEMFAIIGEDGNPSDFKDKNVAAILERQGETLVKMGKELNDAAVKILRVTGIQGDHIYGIVNGHAKLNVKVLEGNEPPLVIVDGEEVSSVEDINMRKVQSIEVIKGQEAIDKYGERGKNGVIIMEMKK